MDEQGYLMLIEDDEADLIVRLKSERRVIASPDQANDIPINEAVAACQHISAELHRGLRAYEQPSGLLT